MATGSTGERRVALVIGNASYQNENLLRNSENDARAMAAALERLDFEVMLHLNLRMFDLQAAVRDFQATASNADVAVTYYAGHAIEVSGKNYLLPVDIVRPDYTTLHRTAYELTGLTASAAAARSLNLVILDACRNNHLKASMTNLPGGDGLQRGSGGGLAVPIVPYGNVLIAFAAQPGQPALDGDGQHSPYTEALLAWIETPDLEVDWVLRHTKDMVVEKTGGIQIPTFFGDLGGERKFLRRSQDRDDEMYARVVELARSKAAALSAYQAYLEAFPMGRHAARVKRHIAELGGVSTSVVPRPSVANSKGGRLIETHRHADPLAAVAAVTFAPARQRAISGSRDKSLCIWDWPRPPRAIDLPARITALAVNGTGAICFVGFEDGSVRQIDLESGRELSHFAPHSQQVSHLLLTRDDTILLSTGYDRALSRTWVETLAGWRPDREPRIDSWSKAHGDRVLCVALSPSPLDRTSVTAGRDGKIKLWRLDDEPLSHQPPIEVGSGTGAIHSIDFSANGRYVLWACGNANTINRFELQTGSEASFPAKHNGEIRRFAVSRSRRLLVSGDVTGMLNLWDAENGTLVDTLKAGGPAITSVAISHDERTAITGDESNHISLWDIS